MKRPMTRIVPLWKVQDLLSSGAIKLDATYQRDVVWNASKMSLLVDSLLKRYYIPPLIFANKTDRNGNQIRVCIDGKQRLTSILRFTQNKIPFLDESSGTTEEVYFDEDAGTEIRSKQYRFFSSIERDNFNDVELMFVEYHDLDDDEELEIFSRVQMGVTTTASEKLMVTNTDVAKLTHRILNSFPAFTNAVTETKGQAQAFKYISQLLLILLEDNADLYVATFQKLNNFLKDKSVVLPERFPSQATHVFKRLNQIFEDDEGKKTLHYCTDNDNSLHRQLVKNTEVIVLGYYISKCKKTTKTSELIEDFKNLRTYFMNTCGTSIHTGNPSWQVGMEWMRMRLVSKKGIPYQQSRQGHQDQHSDVENEEEEESDENENEPHRPLIPASKRRRGNGISIQAADHNDYNMENVSSSLTVGQRATIVNGRSGEKQRPLARRGGHRSAVYGRKS